MNCNCNEMQALSSVYGKIERILLIYAGKRTDIKKEDIAERFGPYFQAFGDRVEFVVLANGFQEGTKEAEAFESLVETVMEDSQLFRQHHTILMETLPIEKGDLTRWAQDPFVVLNDENGKPVLLDAIEQRHEENALITEHLVANMNILLKPSPLHFEGGNILVGDDFALIGMDVLEANKERYFPNLAPLEAKKRLTEEFKRALGLKYIIWVGYEESRPFQFGVKQGKYQRQPLFHLDLFLTLGGKHQPTGEEVVFLAEMPKYAYSHLGEKIQEEMERFAKALDEIEIQLEQLNNNQPGPNFKVERFPLGLRADKAETQVWIFPYNNCHVEWFHGIKRIYLPSYGEEFETQQDHLKRTLRGLEYKVTFVHHHFENAVRFGNGSLHCLTKVLRRGRY